ncbi:hypothetical protein D3C81_1338820 [compost metagenome]
MASATASWMRIAGCAGSATSMIRSPVTTGLPSQSLGSLYTATPARGDVTWVRCSWERTAASSARRCAARLPSRVSSFLLCGLSKARWLAASSSASATATSLPSTSARLRRVVSSRANSGVPASTVWLGRTCIRAITPSMGELMICASCETISAGARAVWRTGMSSTSREQASASRVLRRPGRQRDRRRRLASASQQ